MDQPYSPFADGLSPAHAWLAAFGDAGSGWGSAEGASLTALGDKLTAPSRIGCPNSISPPEPIQALWIVALSAATILGVTWIVMRGLREITIPDSTAPSRARRILRWLRPEPGRRLDRLPPREPRARPEERPGPDRAGRARGRGARCDAPTGRRELIGLGDGLASRPLRCSKMKRDRFTRRGRRDTQGLVERPQPFSLDDAWAILASDARKIVERQQPGRKRQRP